MGRSKAAKSKRKTAELIVGSDVENSGSDVEETPTTQPEEQEAPAQQNSGAESEEEESTGGKKAKFMSKKAQLKAEQAAKQAAKKGGKGGAAAEQPPQAGEKKEIVATDADGNTRRIKVTYCPHCTFPAEMCEFGGMYAKCKPWLEENAAMLEAEMGSSLQIADGDMGRKQKTYGEKKASGSGEQVILFNVKKKGARGKVTTAVHGLDAFGLDLKDICTKFKKKFSCACTIQEVNGFADAVELQGDMQYEIVELLTSSAYGSIPTKKMYVLGKGNSRTPLEDA